MNIWNWLAQIFGGKKPAPVVPQPDPQYVLTLKVQDENGAPMPAASIFWDGLQPGEGNTDDNGVIVLPPRPHQGFNITAKKTGYEVGWAGVNFNATQEVTISMMKTPVPPVPAPPAYEIPEEVYVDGRIFRKKSNGQPWRYKVVSMFYALQRWDRGEDLSAWVNWTHQVGANGWRVFCQFKFANGTDPLAPGQISAARIAEFVKWAMTQGLVIELTVLTDTQSDGFNMTLDEEVARVKAVLAAVTGLPVFMEIKNEPFKNGGRIVEICAALGLRDKKNRPVLMATGDYDIVGNEDKFFALDYVTDHAERKPDWSAEAGKTGHFIYDGWAAQSAENGKGWTGFKGQNVAVVADEPIGAAEIDQPGRRDANPKHFEEGGGGFGMGISGGCGHLDAGSIGNNAGHAPHGAAPIEVPGPVQTACMTAFFAGMDFFPADAFMGDYAHDGFMNHPVQSSGAYGECASRVFGNRAYAVAAMPTDKWTPVPVGGWHIVKTAGWRNELVELAR